MSAWTHTLRNFPSGYWLEQLRDHPEDPSVRRVEEILTLLVTADRLLREQDDFTRLNERALGRSELLGLSKKNEESKRAYYQTLEILNIKLSGYRWEARLEGDLHGFRSRMVPALPGGHRFKYSGRKDLSYIAFPQYSEYTRSFLAQRDRLLAQAGRPDSTTPVQSGWEASLVKELMELLDKGEISRYRRCSECRRWFYAIRGHQRFCGDVCRRKHEAQSPAFKEKRARYMRETYRPDQKRKDERAKRQAGFSEKLKKGATHHAKGGR